MPPKGMMNAILSKSTGGYSKVKNEYFDSLSRSETPSFPFCLYCISSLIQPKLSMKLVSNIAPSNINIAF